MQRIGNLTAHDAVCLGSMMTGDIQAILWMLPYVKPEDMGDGFGSFAPVYMAKVREHVYIGKNMEVLEAIEEGLGKELYENFVDILCWAERAMYRAELVEVFRGFYIPTVREEE